MAAALRGRADVDDALQQAYLRLLNEYDRWPADQSADDRLAFAYRTVHLAAKDVLRHEFGRSDRAPRPRELPVDFSGEARQDAEATDVAPTQQLAHQRLSESASRYPGDEEHLDHALKIAALTALDPIARHIVTASQLGLNHKQVAKQLGLTHQTVRAKDSEARALLLSLIACARGRDVREATDINLFGYLEGQKLPRAQRRLVQGHLKHCANCQEIAALQTEVDALAQRLVLPLPLLLGAGGTLRHLARAVTRKFASGGPKGAAVGSSSASFGGGARSPALASLGGGKFATGLAVLAVAGAAGTATVVQNHGQTQSTARVVRTAGGRSHAKSRQPIRPTGGSSSSKRAAHLKHHHHPHHHHAALAAASSSTSGMVTAATPPTSGSAAGTAPAHSPGPLPPRTSESSSRGGEFVLGGG